MSTAVATRVPVYRLTPRGRLVVFLLALSALAALALVLAGGSVASGEAEATSTVVVAPGETLWSIASEASDGRDVRDMMDHLVAINGLDSVVLAAGQQLEVPVD